MWSNVDLPEPLTPMTAIYWPLFDLEIHVAEGVNLSRADTIVPGKAAGLDKGSAGMQTGHLGKWDNDGNCGCNRILYEVATGPSSP